MLRFALVCSLILISIPNAALAQMVVAHRGSSHDAPENTISAFKLAWQQNADGIEGDFYVTKDDQIVCIHDADTKRTAGKKLTVESSTLAELRQLEYGAWKAAKWKGEPIPTLRQVLETVPDGKTIVIEIKSKQAVRFVSLLKKQLTEFDTSKIKILLISFHVSVVQECRKQLPSHRVHWLTGFETTRLGKRPTAKQIGQTIKRSGANGVGMKGDRSLIDTELISTMKAHGCPEFHVWTIDDVRNARYFQSLGAVGVTTNVPALVGAAIREEKKKKKKAAAL